MKLNPGEFVLVVEGDEIEETSSKSTDADQAEVEVEVSTVVAEWSDSPATVSGSVSEVVAEKLNASCKAIATPSEGRVPAYTAHPAAAIVVGEVSSSEAWKLPGLLAQVSTTSRALSARLRHVLSARSLAAKARDVEAGKLDRRKLHVLNLPGRKPSRRVFEKSTPGASNKVAVSVFLDLSGSMGNDGRIEAARLALLALCEALDGLSGLGVRFQAWGFDAALSKAKGNPLSAEAISVHGRPDNFTRIEDLRFWQIKADGENWRKVRSRVGAIMSQVNNCDGESVRWAAARLLEVAGVDRRVLIVLSDGFPQCAVGNGGHKGMYAQTILNNDLRAAVEESEEAGVEVLGIGIMTDAVKEFYPNHAVVHVVADLEPTLIAGLAKVFK